MVCTHITHIVGCPAKFMEIQVDTPLQEATALVAPPAPLALHAYLWPNMNPSHPSQAQLVNNAGQAQDYATGYITGAVQIATGLCWGINNPSDLHTTAPHDRSTTAHVPERQQACWYLAGT